MAINADKWPKQAREIAEAEFAAGRTAPYVRARLVEDGYNIGALPIPLSTVANWRRLWGHKREIAQMPRNLEEFAERNEARVKLLHDMADYQAERCRQRVLKGSTSTDEIERLARLQTALSKLKPVQETPQPGVTEGDTEPDGTSEFMQRLEEKAAKPRRRASKRSPSTTKKQTAARNATNAAQHGETQEDGAMAVPSGMGSSGQAGGSS